MSIQHAYSYEGVLTDSQKINWRVEDLINADRRLDFSKTFLPDSLAGVARLESLAPHEKLLLNQIRGATYLHLFGLVEEFILPFVLERARADVHGDKQRVRALLTFAEEEAKHQVLFARFGRAFEEGFPVKPGFIGPARQIAEAVLGHGTLGIALLVLHLEWLTQVHYLESVKSDEGVDPVFSSLLRHHWQEEAQHAKLDTLLVTELAAQSSPAAIEKGIDDFLAIGALLEGGLRQQVTLDLATLEQGIGRQLTDKQRSEVEATQARSYRWTFLVSGLDQQNFVKTVGELSQAGLVRIRETARALS